MSNTKNTATLPTEAERLPADAADLTVNDVERRANALQVDPAKLLLDALNK